MKKIIICSLCAYCCLSNSVFGIGINEQLSSATTPRVEGAAIIRPESVLVLGDEDQHIDLPGGGMLHCSDKDEIYELERERVRILLTSSLAAKILAYILKNPGCSKKEIGEFVITSGIGSISSVKRLITCLRGQLGEFGLGITNGSYGYRVVVEGKDKEINFPGGFTLKRDDCDKVKYVLIKGSKKVDLSLNQKKVLESIWNHQKDGGATTQQIVKDLKEDVKANYIGSAIQKLQPKLEEVGLRIENERGGSQQGRYQIIESPLNGFKSSSKALEGISSTSEEVSGENLLQQRLAAEKRKLPPVIALLGEDDEDSASEGEPNEKRPCLDFGEFESCAQWIQRSVNEEN